MNGALLLFGYAGRDRDETVCQFFPDTVEGRLWLEDFKIAMPGRYRVVGLGNVDYDAIDPDPEDCHALARLLNNMFMEDVTYFTTSDLT